MRSLAALCLALAFCPTTDTAEAQVRLLPYTGYALSAGYDNGASFVADETVALETQGGVIVGLGAAFPILAYRFPFDLSIRPSAEVTLLSGETVTFPNAGESLDFGQFVLRGGGELTASYAAPHVPVVPSLGFGLAFTYYTADFDASPGATVVGNARVTAWAIGPSLSAGLRFGAGSVSPFVQGRYHFADPDPGFRADRPGTDLDNGFSVVAGVSVAL